MFQAEETAWTKALRSEAESTAHAENFKGFYRWSAVSQKSKDAK